MEIIIGDLLTVEGEKYITIEKLTYEGNNYIFVNKVINEEDISEEFYIFEVTEDGVRMIIDGNLMNELLPKFEMLLKNDINYLIGEK